MGISTGAEASSVRDHTSRVRSTLTTILQVCDQNRDIFVGNSDVEKAHEMRQVWMGKTVGGAHSA